MIFAIRTIPVADVYCSRQPLLPHPHTSVSSSFTQICPISPPAPLVPASIFPFKIIPPPTPVPSVTITISLWPFPPPCHISPSAAMFASFPAFTGRSNNLLSSSSTLKIPHPRFTHLITVPSAFTGPGTPIPTPATSDFSILFSSSLSSTDAAISLKIYFPPSSVLVVISHFSTISPCVVNRPIFTVVPPISTPNT